MNNGGFRLPKQFTNQLEEFSKGYYLIVVNEQGNIESFESFDDPATRLAIINFADVQISAMLQHLRNRALMIEQQLDEKEEGDDNQESF